MKNYILSLLALSAFVLCSCEKENWVEPTADRSGITSMAAYFTSGDYNGKCAIDWKITDSADMTDYVIPVPYYYPAESDNETSPFMSAMKIVATLENNCTISPAIAVLDLTKKNEFTYTDDKGVSKKITISGELTRSSECEMKAITIQPGNLAGVINGDTISLIGATDLSEATAEVTLSPHATISPDPSVPHNMNNGFQFTVTADNGIDKKVYTIVKQTLPKIPSGFRKGSETTLFENDMTMLGVTSANDVHPTLACIGSYVIMNLADGSVPQYFKKATGTRVGTIALGAADASGAIASDCAGNMLICNYAASGDLKIYKTDDPTTEPTLWTTFNNQLGVAVGSRLQIQGDLDNNAVVIATCEFSNSYVRWIVKNGKVGEPEVIGLTGIAQFWYDYDNIPKVSSYDEDTKAVFVDHYESGNCPLYYAEDGTAATVTISGSTSGWGHNTGAIDVREFNNAKYLCLFEMGYWPDWGMPGTIYMYDVTNPYISGETTSTTSMVTKYSVGDDYAGIGYAGTNRFADVLMTPSEDGYFMYIFYVSNTHLSFGGYQIDCIQK